MSSSQTGEESASSKPDLAEWLTLVLGPVMFGVVVIGGLVAAIAQVKGANLGAWLQGAGAGTGLLAVGHSIHLTSRRSRDSA